MLTTTHHLLKAIEASQIMRNDQGMVNA